MGSPSVKWHGVSSAHAPCTLDVYLMSFIYPGYDTVLGFCGINLSSGDQSQYHRWHVHTVEVSSFFRTPILLTAILTSCH